MFEVLFILKGRVGVGYRLFNEVFMGLALKERQVVNDYAIIHNKVSEFLYQPLIDDVEGLIIDRSNMLKILQENFWKRFLPQWTRTYERKIQSIVVEHRREMALKFKNRIDYVDLGAFGMNTDESNNVTEIKLKQFNTMIEKYSGVGLLHYRLTLLEGHLNNVCYQILASAIKYDQEMDAIFSTTSPKVGSNPELTKENKTSRMFAWDKS